ncbi:unnamed protein product [Durusdinium trenchii]|uniref:TFIIS N-terminal domain-containing protein n=2 Tax=Durusdinium trenchii TaxID=1381693 RepID=A0ABP0K8X9_9DINO
MANDAANIKELEACRDKLQACRDGSGKTDAASIVSIFRAMSKVSVSVQSLRATGVAKEANHVFFRNNPDIKVREACAKLIASWKEIGLAKRPATPPVAETLPPALASGKGEEEAPMKPSKEKRTADVTKPDKTEKAKRSKKTEEKVGDTPNAELAAQFKELASHEFKKGGTSKFAGIAFNKVVAILNGLEQKVTSGSSIAHLPGIGKETVKKIDQYLEKGIIDKLERIRNGEED